MPDIKIEGYKEAIQVLDQLTNQMQKKLIKQALQKAAAPMVSAARTRAPKRTGALAKSIRIAPLRKDRKPTMVSIAVAPVFDVTKNDKVNAFYGRFVHDGTKDRKPKGTGSRKARGGSKMLVFAGADGGKVFTRSARGLKPNPFMLDAFNSTANESAERFGSDLAASVEKFVNNKFKAL